MNFISNKSYIYIIILFLIIISSVYIFVEFADHLLEEEKFFFDREVRQYVNAVSTGTLDSVFTFITELGSVRFITVCSIMLSTFLFFFYRSRKWRIVYFLVAIIGIGILTKTLKVLFERKRPNILEHYDGTGFSFPSGHSTGSMVFYGFIVYLTIRSHLQLSVKWLFGVLLSILILLIGFSRVYLGVHYASDVIAGHLLGLGWLVSCVLILEYTLWRKK
ncbi:phosphatase PAP2 family protein [Tenuibacillus multivorans]|nr:phosphatase PAP2 family protein [Tenuibacillus multivorans]